MRTKKLKQHMIFLTLSLLPLLVSCEDPQLVKVTVVSEEGNPIEAAEVTVRFFGAKDPAEVKQKGQTNEEGIFEARGKARLSIFVYAIKKGYYRTKSNDLSISKDHNLTLTLREKKNPIPLYAGKFRKKINVFNVPYGLDLEKGDWVPPYGEGQIVDLICKVIPVESESGEPGGNLEVTFPGESEGVLIVSENNGYFPLSEMKMPNDAPLQPYQSKIERVEFGYQNLNKPKNTSYFFRTREKVLSNGELTYHYSKFLNGIDFHMGGGKYLDEPSRSKFPDEYGAIDFIYYFNPERNDQNLEFNPSQNLVKGLRSWERVKEP